MTLLALTTGLGAIDYLVVLLYLAVMLAMGIYFSRRQTSSEEYFVGRRRLPPMVVGISIIASLLSTITYLAAPGDMIQYGIYFATGLLAVPFWLAVVQWFWIPFFMRYRLTSIYEYAEFRFSYPVRALAASIFIFMRFGWMGTVIYTAARAVAKMTENLPGYLYDWTGVTLTPTGWLYSVMILMGVIATGYTYMGGIRVVIWTDVIQFFVMMGGAVFAIAFIWYQTGTGPVHWWQQTAASTREPTDWFSWDLTADRVVLFFVLNTFFWRICTHCGDQVATQRYFTTDGIKSALKSNLYNVMGDVVLTVLLGLVGLALLSFFDTQSTPELAAEQAALFGGDFDPHNAAHAKDAYPKFIVYYLPPGLAGLVMAALFAAAMSSIDSGINSIAAVVTTDFYRRLRKAGDKPSNDLWIARTITFVTGVAITLVAFWITWYTSISPKNENIIDLSIRVFNLFLGPLGGIFMVGVFLSYVRTASMLIGTLGGLTCSIMLGYWDLFFETTGPSVLLVTPVSTVVTFALSALAGAVQYAISGPPEKSKLRGHTWNSRGAITEPVDDSTDQ